MTNEQILIGVGLVALVAIVFLLKDKIFSVKGSRKGFVIDSQQPVQRPGVVVKGARSREGAVKVENNMGDGLKAEDLDGAKGVSATNNPIPKK